MTKADLVEDVANKADITKKQAKVIVDTFIDSIIEALHNHEKTELRGFGSFRIRHRDARTGRNPRTGEQVEVPEKIVPYFKPGKDIRETLKARDVDED